MNAPHCNAGLIEKPNPKWFIFSHKTNSIQFTILPLSMGIQEKCKTIAITVMKIQDCNKQIAATPESITKSFIIPYELEKDVRFSAG